MRKQLLQTLGLLFIVAPLALKADLSNAQQGKGLFSKLRLSCERELAPPAPPLHIGPDSVTFVRSKLYAHNAYRDVYTPILNRLTRYYLLDNDLSMHEVSHVSFHKLEEFSLINQDMIEQILKNSMKPEVLGSAKQRYQKLYPSLDEAALNKIFADGVEVEGCVISLRDGRTLSSNLHTSLAPNRVEIFSFDRLMRENGLKKEDIRKLEMFHNHPHSGPSLSLPDVRVAKNIKKEFSESGLSIELHTFAIAKTADGVIVGHYSER